MEMTRAQRGKWKKWGGREVGGDKADELVVPVAVDRESSERSVEVVGSATTVATGWTSEGDQPRHRVMPVAVGREGSKRSVVAAGSGRAVTTRWTSEGDSPQHRLMMETEGPFGRR